MWMNLWLALEVSQNSPHWPRLVLRRFDIHRVSPGEMIFVFHRSPVRMRKEVLRNETCVVFISLREPDTPSTADTANRPDSHGNHHNPVSKGGLTATDGIFPTKGRIWRRPIRSETGTIAAMSIWPGQNRAKQRELENLPGFDHRPTHRR
jgi:hypothetical protein